MFSWKEIKSVENFGSEHIFETAPTFVGFPNLVVGDFGTLPTYLG